MNRSILKDVSTWAKCVLTFSPEKEELLLQLQLLLTLSNSQKPGMISEVVVGRQQADLTDLCTGDSPGPTNYPLSLSFKDMQSP